MNSIQSYKESVNFFRAFSIVAIVLYHVFPTIVSGGFLGVCFFFFISGYLASGNAEARSLDGSGHLGNYYLRKARRIYPALYVMVVSVVAFFTLFHKELLIGIREEALSIFLGYNNWWQMLTQASYFLRVTEHSPFTHLWYMGVEMELLVVWPILYLFYKKVCEPHMKKEAVLFFLFLAIASAIAMGLLYDPANPNRVYYGTDTRAFAFLFGVCLGLRENAWQARFGAFWSGRRGKVLTWGLLFVMMALFVYVTGEEAWLYRGGMAAICLLFGGIVFLMNATNFSKSIIGRSRIIRWIGRNSYLIYLWHYPLLFVTYL